MTKSGKVHKYICRNCGRVFCGRTNTPFTFIEYPAACCGLRRRNLTMKKIGYIPVTMVIFLMFTIGISSVNAQETAWEIGPRILPVSVDVSDVMRESLLETPTPDAEAAKSLVFNTTEQWEEFIKDRDAPSAANARKLAEVLSVTVEPYTIAGVNVYYVTPPEIAPEHKNQLFVHLHGGAYVFNGGEAGTTEAVLLASRLKMPVISIDYRMPPKFPAPAAMDDVVAVWKQLLEDRSATSMAMGGTSAGGGLTMTSVQRFKELGLPLPGALFLGTPASDVNKVGDSRYINEGIDRNLVAWEGIPYEALKLYASNYDLKNPYVSPIYGNFTHFPPTYLISGTRDLLLSDTVRVHRALQRAGVEVDLNIYEGQSHADYLVVLNAPESYEAFAELNAFLLEHLEIPLVPFPTPMAETLKDNVISEYALA